MMIRRLAWGLAAVLLAGVARADELPAPAVDVDKPAKEPRSVITIEGTADSKVRVTTPGGLVIESERLTLPAPSDASEADRKPVIIEAAPGGKVSLLSLDKKLTASKITITMQPPVQP